MKKVKDEGWRERNVELEGGIRGGKRSLGIKKSGARVAAEGNGRRKRKRGVAISARSRTGGFTVMRPNDETPSDRLTVAVVGRLACASRRYRETMSRTMSSILVISSKNSRETFLALNIPLPNDRRTIAP